MRDSVTVQSDGSVRPRISDETEQALTTALVTDRRDYSKVHSPILAIFAETMVDMHSGGPTDNPEVLAWEKAYMAPFRAATVQRIRRELPGVGIVNVSGTHNDFVFISSPQVVAAMRRFLSEPGSQK